MAKGDSQKRDKGPWYEWSIVAVLVSGALLLIGNLLTTTLPILSSDTGDFYISVQPVPVEAKPFDPEFLPDNLEKWSKVSTEFDTAQAIVKVDDFNKYIKNYRHPVYLRSDENYNKNHNLIIRFDTPTQEPPFKASMFVYVTDPEESLDLFPLTIEGVGGDGKRHNCTIYINHKSPKYLVREGIIQARRGNYSDALRLFNKSIELNKSYALAWKNKGIVLARYFENEDETAIYCLNRSLDLNSLDAETWNIRAYVLLKRGYYKDSLLCSEKAINLSPKYAWAWNNKGIALMKIGHELPRDSKINIYTSALESFNKSLDLDRNYEDAWINKGIALDWIGITQIDWMGQDISIEDLSPYEIDIIGKYDEAIRAFDKAIELNLKNPHTWYNKALTLGHRGKYAEARQTYNETKRLYPEYFNRSVEEMESEALRFREM
jgi:tetratricopeptide (TPR) repeat protein